MTTLQQWCDQNDTIHSLHLGEVRRVGRSNHDEKALWGLESLSDYKITEKATGYILLEPKPPAILRTNHTTKTAEDCFDSGERDGFDGTRYYDPRSWELVEGDHVRDVQHKGVALGCKLYAEGYRKGRLRRFFGSSSFPSDRNKIYGDTRYDAEILATIDPALFIHESKLYYKSMGETFRVACMPNGETTEEGQEQTDRNANYFMERCDNAGVITSKSVDDGYGGSRYFVIICAIKATKLETTNDE